MTKIADKENQPEAVITEVSLGMGLKAVYVSTPETRKGYRADRDGNEVMADRRRAERTEEGKKS